MLAVVISVAAATTLPEAVIRQDDRGLEFSLPRKPCSNTEFVLCHDSNKPLSWSYCISFVTKVKHVCKVNDLEVLHMPNK